MDRDTVGLIYAGLEDPALWKLFLQHLMEEMNASFGNFPIIFHRHGVFSTQTVVGLSDEDLDEYTSGKWKGQDPWLAHGDKFQVPPGTMRMSQELCPDEELEQTEVYKQFLAPRGLHYGGGVMLAATEWQASLMILIRPKERGPFTEREQSHWRAYVPHLMRAVRILENKVRLQSERDLLYSALDDTHSGMLLLNSAREILLANQTAERLIHAGRGVRRKGGVLRAESSADEKALQEAFMQVGRVTEESWIQRLKVSRGPDQQPLMLMAWQVPVQQSLTEKPIMVRIVDPGLQAELDESALRELFLLTRAESHLACQLACGVTLKQAAETAHVSINTARTHLARVFGKTGTKSQSQLVSLVLQIAGGRGQQAPQSN